MKELILKYLKEGPLPIEYLSKLLNKNESDLKIILDNMINDGLIKYNFNTSLYKLVKENNKRVNVNIDEVYDYFKEYEYFSIDFISKKINSSIKELQAILNELVNQNKITKFKKNNKVFYSILYEADLIVKDYSTFAFVDEKKYYITNYNNITPYTNDKCLICPTFHPSYGNTEAMIVKITKRSNSVIIGELKYKKNNKCIIKSNMTNFNATAAVDFKDTLDASTNDIVIADIISYNPLKAKVKKIIGNKYDVGIDITQLALEYGFKTEFSDLAINELNDIEDEVNESDIKNRVDYRDLSVITIDGDDSKDFDDAVYLEKINNNYKLYVFIADVSFYVKEDSALDKDALDRGTSLYLADRVIPMLPEKLSNGICSLNEGVDRLVLSCIMNISSSGKLLDYEINEGVIRSHHRMTYKNVNEILNGNMKITNEYLDIKDMLFDMLELSNIIRRLRYKKGALDFDTDEYKFTLDEDGNPLTITKRVRDKAEMLIEDFMLEANETVAYHMNIMNLPIMYRVHEKPDQEQLHNTFKVFQNMKLINNVKNEDIKPKDILKFQESIKDNINYQIINNLLLRSMMKARYSNLCLGHYGLQMQYYCHFTSPIRRYPDLITHRLIKKLFIHPTINLDDDINHYNSLLSMISEKNSFSERKSIECERKVNDILYAKYMSKRLNKEYDGIITSITSFGLFVSLENGIEGLVAYRMIDDYFVFNENTLTAVGEKNTYHLGDKIKIIVDNVDVKNGKIDFIIKNHGRKYDYEDYMY